MRDPQAAAMTGPVCEPHPRGKIKKVVFMGTPEFAVPSFRALLEPYTVQAVFTQPDKPKGRGKSVTVSPVKEAALAAGVPIFQPVKIREDANLKVIADLAPDAIVVAAFGQILPPGILACAPYGCINVHASLLPAYRGAAPIQWAVINGEKESGVTTMRMDAGLDTGDMILQEAVPLEKKETAGSLSEKLSRVGADLLLRTLKEMEEGTACFQKQPEKSPTPYARMLNKQMGRIDWEEDAAKIECRVRGLAPWPSAYTTYQGKTLKVWEADVLKEASGDAPGTILKAAGKDLWVQTGRYVLKIAQLQLEGKKRMDTGAFLRGFAVREGERFGI